MAEGQNRSEPKIKKGKVIDRNPNDGIQWLETNTKSHHHQFENNRFIATSQLSIFYNIDPLILKEYDTSLELPLKIKINYLSLGCQQWNSQRWDGNSWWVLMST